MVLQDNDSLLTGLLCWCDGLLLNSEFGILMQVIYQTLSMGRKSIILCPLNSLHTYHKYTKPWISISMYIHTHLHIYKLIKYYQKSLTIIHTVAMYSLMAHLNMLNSMMAMERYL